MDNKKKFTEQSWFVILMFFLVWTIPVGLYFMWKNKMFSKMVRQVITSFTLSTILIIIANFFFGHLEVPESKVNVPVIEKVEKIEN